MDVIGFLKFCAGVSCSKTGSLISCSEVSGSRRSGLSQEALLNTAKDCLSSRLYSVAVS
ncbi:Uncharacterized protein APZ42_010970 [Daphnia magna]|uniref:Uncharacterized protein n=1 Tax=Daphnia magna TaxID=35525 RepID=A0A162TCA3_9CRUS|nr:Uncharacterized protein APZ42_010970 [Daphnia magna]